MEKRTDLQAHSESKTQLLGKINACLRSGEYTRANDLLRASAAEFPNDAEFSELEKLAQDGITRKAEADRLITQSQDLFARQKSGEAIQLLREAYALDKNNSLARAILANALVEQANSIVETDWLEAETLANQALALNPAHPTAKTIRNLIVDQKKTSSVEDWVSQARKRQSSGDLFAALAWVAEGLAVHPDDPKLLQIQEGIQRDQSARRRQTRRGDLEDLRRMEREIDAAADVGAKQALAARIQALAAKYWTDGEILSIANALLLRLGLVSQESSGASPRSKSATLILHVPRPSAARPGTSPARPSQVSASPVSASEVPANEVSATAVSPKEVQPNSIVANVPTRTIAASKVPATIEPASEATPIPQEPQVRSLEGVAMPAAESPAPAAKVTSPRSRTKQPPGSNSTTLIVVTAAAIILVAAVFFFVARKHQASPAAKIPIVAPAISPPAISSSSASTAPVSVPTVSDTAPKIPKPSPPAPDVSSDTAAESSARDNLSPSESEHNLGTLLVVAGQDGARVFLNGKLQPQLTQAGKLRVPNLEPGEYVVHVSKNGFQDSPEQKIRIRNGDEQARLVFHLRPQTLQAQPRLAALSVQGGTPGTTILVDQVPIGTIQPDGTLSVPNVNPGDHTVELRKERFKPRQFKKHFVAGGSITLVAADVALEAVPGELRITFTPANANVALVKGDLLKMVSSGVPLSLAPGTYTLTARTAERFTRSSTIEVTAGQSTTLDLSLAPAGMLKWDDPGAWKQEKDAFIRKGGDFVLYGVVPTSGTFAFSAIPTKGRLLQWVLNFTDGRNYVLFQMDENNFYRSLIRNGEKTDEIIVPYKGEKKSFHTLQIRVGPTEIVHQVKHGESWTILDRWTQPGANLSQGKFGFYIPGNDQVELSSFAYYADLNVR